VEEWVAELVGLPRLNQVILPVGYREYRFEVRCDLCLPTYLVLLQQQPSGRVVGDAYLQWFRPDPDSATDASTAARTVANTPDNCAGPLHASHDSTLSEYTWCAVREKRGTDWNRLLANLDSLGIGGIPTKSGYAPDPPTFGIDTVRLNPSRPVHVARRHCGDMGGQSFLITTLRGAEHRSALFWCLESDAAPGSEHARVKEMRRLLLAAIEQPSS
jgi:hypothetical protein